MGGEIIHYWRCASHKHSNLLALTARATAKAAMTRQGITNDQKQQLHNFNFFYEVNFLAPGDGLCQHIALRNDKRLDFVLTQIVNTIDNKHANVLNSIAENCFPQYITSQLERVTSLNRCLTILRC